LLGIGSDDLHVGAGPESEEGVMRAETDVLAPSLGAHAEACGEIIDGGPEVRSGVDEVIDHDPLNGSP
jgi:hypothetical protein